MSPSGGTHATSQSLSGSGKPFPKLQIATNIRAPMLVSSTYRPDIICKRAREIPVSSSHSRRAFARIDPSSCASLPPFGKPKGPYCPTPAIKHGAVCGRGCLHAEHAIHASYICFPHLEHVHFGAFSTMHTYNSARCMSLDRSGIRIRNVIIPAPQCSGYSEDLHRVALKTFTPHHQEHDGVDFKTIIKRSWRVLLTTYLSRNARKPCPAVRNVPIEIP
jgi:hypothetical protein